jgi:transposase InsO family protein
MDDGSRMSREVHLRFCEGPKVKLLRPTLPYVRLAEAFVYLAVVLDAFSRRVVGWALADHLEASLAIEALDMALSLRDPAPMSLIHHSDRGVQYASNAYLARLNERKIAVSMSRPANPYDNAKAESFMKTLKQEEVYARTYIDIADARRQIGAFIDTVYNAKRLHSALGYKPPSRVRGRIPPGQPQPNKQGRSPVTELAVSQPRGAVQFHDLTEPVPSQTHPRLGSYK